MVVAGFFGLWLLGSVLAQFPFLPRRVARISVGGLFPRWNFFSSNFSAMDLVLEGRASSEAEWKEVDLPTGRRGVGSLFSPNRRFRKALLDLTISMTHMRLANIDRTLIAQSKPYQALQREVARMLRTPGDVQFRIRCKRPGDGHWRTVFVSGSPHD